MTLKQKKLWQTIFLLAVTPLLVLAVKTTLDLRKSAAGTLANIVIDRQNPQNNNLSFLWQNISQGGEEPLDMIRPAIAQIRSLQPKIIRLDHLFDYYQVDQGNGHYDFARLDSAINSILLTGARPMLSLSYTPDAKAPADWNQWSQLVQATARHYSVDQKIDNIYYEVWNEPDLFGGWHYNHDPNYLTLYLHTARAIQVGAAGSNYKIGGPATTAFYPNWIKALFDFTTANNLPLNFISWHKYSKNITDYETDFEKFNQILTDYPQYTAIERFLTEVGPNSNPDDWYDNALSGIHLISLSTRMAGKFHRLFSFEAIDGPQPRSNTNSGWGLVTHDLKPKPRYFALQFLNQLQGQQLNLTGNGSWISGLASLNNQTIQVLLVNYDPNLDHAETFPLTIQNLVPGKYQVKTTQYLGNSSTKTIIATANYRDLIYLAPNSAVFLEITPQPK